MVDEYGICAYCKQKFKRKRHGSRIFQGKFCSIECSCKSKYVPKKKVIRLCKQCGKKITGKRYKDCCSLTCLRKYNLKQIEERESKVIKNLKWSITELKSKKNDSHKDVVKKLEEVLVILSQL